MLEPSFGIGLIVGGADRFLFEWGWVINGQSEHFGRCAFQGWDGSVFEGLIEEVVVDSGVVAGVPLEFIGWTTWCGAIGHSDVAGPVVVFAEEVDFANFI